MDPSVVDGLAGLVNARWTTARSRAEELTKGEINLSLSYQTEVRGDSWSL